MRHLTKKVITRIALLAIMFIASGWYQEAFADTTTPSPPSVISVSSGGPGSLSLSWSPPFTNTDSSPLIDLAGFKVYYGTASAIYTNIIDAGYVTSYSYTITGLSAGTYYISVTAYDNSLPPNESAYSNEANITVSSAAGLDTDLDGITDGMDNCPSVYNPDQANTDKASYIDSLGGGDRYGDVCDNAPLRKNQDQTDTNSNGVWDPIESEVITSCPAVPPGPCIPIDGISYSCKQYSCLSPPGFDMDGAVYAEGDPVYVSAKVTFNPIDFNGDTIYDYYHIIAPNLLPPGPCFPPGPCYPPDPCKSPGVKSIVERWNGTASAWDPVDPYLPPGPCYPPDPCLPPGPCKNPGIIPADMITLAGSSQAFTTLMNLTDWYPLQAGNTYRVKMTYENFLRDPNLDENGNCPAGVQCYTPIWEGVAPGLTETFKVVSGTLSTEVCDGIDNDNDGQIDEGFPGGNTACGTTVGVTSLSAAASVKFDSVTRSGDTTVNISKESIHPPPTGFRLGSPATYYEINTTASFTGNAEVCITYSEADFTTERSLKLFHWELNGWKNITTSINTTTNLICGRTASFSPFVVAQQTSTAVTISNFTVHKDGDRVILGWSTSSETNNEGFTILRGESAGGPFTAISSLIPAIGGVGLKAAYTFTDSGVEKGKTYNYRLQDIDSRGLTTTHNVVPMTMEAAGGEGSSVDKKREETASHPASARNVELSSSPITGTGEQTAGSQRQDRSAAWPGGMVVTGADNNYLPFSNDPAQTETESFTDIPEQMPLHDSKEGGYVNRGIDSYPLVVRKDTSSAEGIAHHISGPSSFSISIEDELGNLYNIRRMDDTEGSAAASGRLEVAEDAGKTILTWQGAGAVRGFTLYRSEKGKGSEIPISGLIPCFSGRDGEDHYLYRFIDNSAVYGGKYEYRLEAIGLQKEAVLKIPVSSAD